MEKAPFSACTYRSIEKFWPLEINLLLSCLWYCAQKLNFLYSVHWRLVAMIGQFWIWY
jgi:hypothetical protein